MALSAEGGTGNYEWSWTPISPQSNAGSDAQPGPPPGLNFDNNGIITGIPTEIGEFWMEFTATDIGLYAPSSSPPTGNPTIPKAKIALPVKVKAPWVEMITPAGDPVNAPVDGAPLDPNNPAGSIQDGANEFTFSAATPGVLTMKLKAKVRGLGSLQPAERAKFRFELDGIGNSILAWDANNNPGGQAMVTGDFIVATATYTGLPQNNNDFGSKKARVRYGNHPNAIAEATYEVFFPRDAKNHPNGLTGWPQCYYDYINPPNWYFYWTQTTANFGTHSYFPGNTSETKFVNNTWSAFIGDTAPGQARAWNYAAGIDHFANVVRHEDTHRTQMTAMWGAGSTRNDIEDNDKDALKDALEPSLVPAHPYDPGKFSTYTDTFGYYPTPGLPLKDAEDYCMLLQPVWTNGAANAKDWSNPGMQHKTLNDPND